MVQRWRGVHSIAWGRHQALHLQMWLHCDEACGSNCVYAMRFTTTATDFCFGISAASDRTSGQASTSEPTEETTFTLKGGQTLFIWGSKSSLQPQGTLEWPLWLHPRSPGILTFHCVWYYEPTTPVEGMKFRSVDLSAWHLGLSMQLDLLLKHNPRAPSHKLGCCRAWQCVF